MVVTHTGSTRPARSTVANCNQICTVYENAKGILWALFDTDPTPPIEMTFVKKKKNKTAVTLLRSLIIFYLLSH